MSSLYNFFTFSKKLVDANSEHRNLCAAKSVKPTYFLCSMLSMAQCCLPARFVVILFVVYVLFLVVGKAFQNRFLLAFQTQASLKGLAENQPKLMS